MKIVDLPKDKKIVDYCILLKNGKTVEVKAETYEVISDLDGNSLTYRFFRMRRPVLEIEAIQVELIMDASAVDIERAVSASTFKKRNRKRQ